MKKIYTISGLFFLKIIHLCSKIYKNFKKKSFIFNFSLKIKSTSISNRCSRKCSKKRETLINKLHRGNKICIVGAAGAAGLHMVVDLREC